MNILSPKQSVHSAPVSYLKQEKVSQNQIILQRYQDGDTLAEIASDYQISIARVHQIICKEKN